jgi:hypothetical protein
MDRLGVGGAIVAAALILTARDLFMSSDQTPHADAAASGDDQQFTPAEPKLKSRFMVPTLKFMYWYVFFVVFF